jgi:hypothetical protein
MGHHAVMGRVGRPARVQPIVGRETELAVLAKLVQDGDIVHVHGLAGIGKSALLEGFVQQASTSGVGVVALDCRAVEPTERGFLQAAGGFDDVSDFLHHLQVLGPPVVVALDHYEVFRLMDTWMRQVLVPRLPDAAGLVLACRERPVPGWFGVEGFRGLSLGPLKDADACALLERRGVAAGDAVRLNRIARGHPLALVLATAGVSDNPQLGLEEAATSRVVEELTRLYFEDIEDSMTRRALEAASVVRRVTEPILAAMIEADASTALRRLLDLPFVEAGRDGLVLHEAVRDAVAGFLRSTNPTRYREYRRVAWRELRDEMREAAPAELWRYTADVLYLIDNPVVREAFFPSDAQPLAVEPARAQDGAALCEIVRRHEGPEAAGLLERWWAEAPETFSVARDREGAVVGFFTLLDDPKLRSPLFTGDPVVDSWARHLRAHPLAKGEVALGLRRWLDAERGEAPGVTQAASWLDVKRTYMALRPALRRIYVVVQDVPTYWPIVEQLGFRPLRDAAARLDGCDYATVALDFGPGSVDGWLMGLLAAQVGSAAEPALDADARELAVNGERIPLTPLEFGLFRHLLEREGKTVSRLELLREVWGTEFTGGSNVVDAVVRSLRVKLGPGAAAVEAVRGSGYRLRGDWRAHLS